MTRKAKPKSPTQIAAEKAEQRVRDFEAVGLQAEAAALLAHAEVVIQRADQKHAETARRQDAFEALKAGMEPGAYDAARRLERDITIRRGEHDHGRPLHRVDGDQQSAYDRNDKIIEAGERVDAVMARLSDRDAWLLLELIVPSPQRPSWRQAVFHITGEAHAHGQGAAVRSACVNLRDAYEKTSRRAA